MKNKYTILSTCTKITLTQGRSCLIDTSDIKIVSPYSWFCRNETQPRVVAHYAVIKGVVQHCKIHHVILGVSPSVIVDHINNNPLDNRRKNLRVVTKQQNAANSRKRRGVSSSKYKGVSLDKRTGKWTSSIKVNYVKRHLGNFVNEIDAALAYNQAAIKYFGEYANLNIIKETN